MRFENLGHDFAKALEAHRDRTSAAPSTVVNSTSGRRKRFCVLLHARRGSQSEVGVSGHSWNAGDTSSPPGWGSLPAPRVTARAAFQVGRSPFATLDSENDRPTAHPRVTVFLRWEPDQPRRCNPGRRGGRTYVLITVFAVLGFHFVGVADRRPSGDRHRQRDIGYAARGTDGRVPLFMPATHGRLPVLAGDRNHVRAPREWEDFMLGDFRLRFGKPGLFPRLLTGSLRSTLAEDMRDAVLRAISNARSIPARPR